MVTLFPECRIGLGVGWVITAFVAGFMLRSGAAWFWPLLTVLACGFVALMLAEMAAASRHQKLLAILYQEADPEEFILRYEPLLSRPCSAVHKLSIHAYLSNAYLALGQAEKALELLDSAPEVRGREAENAKALQAGNRCSIYLQMEDQEKAAEQLEILKNLRKENPSGKEELYGAIPLLEARVALLKKITLHPDEIEKAARGTKSPLLKQDRQLVLAQLYLAQKRTDAAKVILNKVASGDRQLWCVRKAAVLANELG